MEQSNTTTRVQIEYAVEDKIVFFFVAIGIIAITLSIFKMIGFYPEDPTLGNEEEKTETSIEAPRAVNVKAQHTATEYKVESVDPYPVSMHIDALKREIQVLNPASSDIASLDEALLSGVVRHPNSADFQNVGTVFLLGHSSYLPNVINKNFQAFNGIQNLKWGDTVRVRSGEYEYIYSVDRVYQAKASTAEVPLQFDEPKLVLATCNSFGSKDDRYIVEASLVAKKALVSPV